MKQLIFLKRNAALLLLLLAYPVMMNGQLSVQQKMDSLRRLLPTLEGTNKMPVYSELIRYCTGADDDTYRAAVLECLAATKQMDNPRAEGFAMNLRIIFFNSRGYRDSLAHYLPDYLQFWKKHEQWEFYFSGFHNLFQYHFYAGEVDQSLDVSKAMYQEAKQAGFNPGTANALNNMALVYCTQKLYDEAETTFRESIELSRNEESSEALFAAYSGLARLLVTEERYEEAITFCQQWEEAMKAFERHQQKGAPNLLPKWLNLYLVLADIYTQLGQYDKAEAFCRQAAALPNAASPSSKILIYRQQWVLYAHRGQYASALQLLDTILVLSERRGDVMGVRTTISDIARIAYKAGEYRFAADSYRRLKELSDSLTTAEHLSQIDHLRTQYEVDKITAQKEATRNYMFMAIGGCVLLLVALFIYILYSRRLKAKNRSLYQQIQERRQREKAAEEVLEQVPDEKLSRELLLFRQLQERMQTERLFTEPDLNRKKLADILGTNEMYLADAIKEGCGATFSEYISQLRLHYSLELLGTHPELTLEAVAVDSGHNSYSPFFRAFTKTYGMSPSEYWKLSVTK